MRHPALTGELAVFWQVVLRIVADLHGGEPGPFALASIVGSPIRRKHMGRMLARAGSRRRERFLGWDLTVRWLRWTSSHLWSLLWRRKR